MQTAKLVQSWRHGRATVHDGSTLRLAPASQTALAEKCRQAYHWIAENAIISPYVDIHFGPAVRLGRGEQSVEVASGGGFASFILLPLLTLLTSRRMVFVGAPGRGKTSVATLMALLAGYDLTQTRRAIQRGHPQLTIADLLGSPLPSELIRAADVADVKVAWRKWITMRVKIIDEYNRIPTKTQSALLSLMAEGYAEMFEQTIECGRSAWYLTANDDLGGGTFPVIEALKDRIDIVVRCTPFHSRYLNVLADRVSNATAAETFLPQEIVFQNDELAAADGEIREMQVAEHALDLLGFFLGQLEFCRRASDRLELMNKDTLHLSGRRVGHVCTEDCPLDKFEHLCSQTENGVSARVYESIIHYAKALAWFRGEKEAGVDDFRQLLPWILHDKLAANPQSEFYHRDENKVYLTDRASWIGQLFDRAREQMTAYEPIRRRVRALQNDLRGLEHRDAAQLREAQQKVERCLEEILRDNELGGPMHEDLLLLKQLHAKCQRHLQRRNV